MSLFGRKSPPEVGDDGATRFLRLEHLAADAARDVEAAAFPAYSAQFRDGLKRRAVDAVAAAEALPIDPAAARSDGWQLHHVDRIRQASQGAHRRAWAASIRVDEALLKLASVPKPRGAGGRTAALSLALLVLLLGTVALAILLAPTLDLYGGLRSYVVGLWPEAEAFSAEVAFCGALALGALVMGAPALLAVWSGRVRRPLKALFFAADVVFAGALFLVRTTAAGFSWAALSVSVFELAVSLINTIIALGISDVLAEDAALAKPYGILREELSAARRVLDAAGRDARDFEARLADAEKPVALREDGARRALRVRAAASSTAEAAYDASVSKCIAATAKNASDERVLELVGKHVGDEFARESSRRGRRG